MAGAGTAGLAGPGRKTRWPSPVPVRRARIEIIPLIDVMFFLLASFMMVSLSLQKAETFRMALPVAQTAQADFRPGMFHIGIGADGRVSLGKQHVELDELDRLLRERLRSSPSVPVYVTADRGTRHGHVNQVLGRIRAAGVMKIAFVTDPPKATAAP